MISHIHRYDFERKKSNPISNINGVITYSTIQFLKKQCYQQYLRCDHISYNMIFEKSNHVNNIYCVITYCTIWFLKKTMLSADILTVWQRHLKSLTTDSNCLLTSKKFCTLPPQPGGLFDMAGFNGENIYR